MVLDALSVQVEPEAPAAPIVEQTGLGIVLEPGAVAGKRTERNDLIRPRHAAQVNAANRFLAPGPRIILPNDDGEQARRAVFR
jgi:hypothetical protein